MEAMSFNVMCVMETCHGLQVKTCISYNVRLKMQLEVDITSPLLINDRVESKPFSEGLIELLLVIFYCFFVLFVCFSLDMI
jgi:hypothetical protein